MQLPSRIRNHFRLAAAVLLLLTGIVFSTWPTRGAAGKTLSPTVAVFQERDKLLAPDGESGDRLGRAVALSADGLTLVAGAADDDVGAVTDAGSAYVYEYEGGHFVYKQQLVVAGANVKEFGRSVSISGTSIAVGAPGEDGIRGAVYLFTKNGASWTQQQRLAPFGGASGDSFGASVSLVGDTLAVGTNEAIGLNANQGSTFIFTRSGSVWSQQAKLTASDGAAGDNFGMSVALSGETVLIGAPGDTIGLAANQGSAYVFVRNGASWSQQQKLSFVGAAANDNIGYRVALDGDTALIGAWGDDIGFNTDQGAAYVFTRSGTLWNQQAKLTANNGVPTDYFGWGVALLGDRALIGAFNKTVNGTPAQGVAYVFERSGSTWTEQQQLTPFVPQPGYFGYSVALGGSSAAAGAYATSNNTGAVYAYRPTNSNPQLTNVPTLTRSAGSGVTTPVIGQVSDAEQAANTLQMTVNNAVSATVNGVTVSGLFVNNAGQLLANVNVLCNAGNATFTLRATDSEGGTALATLTVNITLNTPPVLSYGPVHFVNAGSALVINPATGPSDNGGVSSVVVNNVQPALTGTISSNNSTGAITISNAGPAGSHTVNVTVLDNCGLTTNVSFTLNVLGTNCPALTIFPANSTLPAAAVGQNYTQTFTASGGTAPYVFQVDIGIFPNGMMLHAQTGVLSGAPTIPGTYNFIMTTGDINGCQGTRAYTMVVAPQSCAVSFPPTPLPAGTLGQSYSVTLAATAGTAPYNYVVTAGALPNGLNLAANGTLSGTLTQAGDFNFSVQATDANGCQATRQATIHVNGVIQPQPMAKKGDFDGDGQADLAVWTGNTGDWSVLKSGNNQTQSMAWGAGYAPYFDVIVPGDYDGDGKQDHAIWRGADSIWYIRKSSDGQPILDLWGANYAPYNDIPTPGDFDGDGRTDLAVFRPTTGIWYVKKSSDGSNLIVQHGQSGDVPLAADFDGDGKCDFGVFRPSAIAPTPNWLILQSATNSVAALQWGGGYAPYFDLPVPADYDGDGKADLAIWRGQDSIWYIRLSATPNSPILELWGANFAPYFDIPVPADYDGDGKSDIAVWRRDGTWFVKCSSNGTSLIQVHGAQGDVPVPASGVR